MGDPEKHIEALNSPEELSEVSIQDVEDFSRLLSYLSHRVDNSPEIVQQQLEASLAAENTKILIVRGKEGRIQASATGNICISPAGKKGWINDVVTMPEMQGKGIGQKLMDGLHQWFESCGAASSNLTSRPDRPEAGRLYERLGYDERNTRVYRRKLGQAAIRKSEE